MQINRGCDNDSASKENSDHQDKQLAPHNNYETSIHVLVSAVLKISRSFEIPSARKVYRGLGGLSLGSEWFTNDERGVRCGVELGFMSTTQNRNVALKYSGVNSNGGTAGTILEIDVGAVDCGGQLYSLSQYQGRII